MQGGIKINTETGEVSMIGQDGSWTRCGELSGEGIERAEEILSADERGFIEQLSDGMAYADRKKLEDILQKHFNPFDGFGLTSGRYLIR